MKKDIEKEIRNDLGELWNSGSGWTKFGIVAAGILGWAAYTFGPTWYKGRVTHNTNKQKAKQDAAKAKEVDTHSANNKIRVMEREAQLKEEAARRDHERWKERRTMMKQGTDMKETSTAFADPTPAYGSTQAAPTPQSPELCDKDPLVGLYVPRNETILLAGPSGIGKTMFKDQIMFRLCGVTAPPLHTTDTTRTTPIPCFIYDNELGKEGFDYRYKDSGLDFSGKLLHYRDLTADTSQEALYGAIEADLLATPGEVVISIDCLYKVKGFKDAPETIYERLNQLRRQHNERTGKPMTVMPVIHMNLHALSPNKSPELNQINGSQNFVGDAKQVLLMNTTYIKDCIRISMAKNNYGKKAENEFIYSRRSSPVFEYMGEYAPDAINCLQHTVSWEEFRQTSATPAPQADVDSPAPKTKRGPKNKVTEENYLKYKEYLKTMSPEAAAKKIGCCQKTIRNYEKDLAEATAHESITPPASTDSHDGWHPS